MRAIDPNFLYGVGVLILAVNLLTYPTIVLFGSATALAEILVRFYWMAAIFFSIPFILGVFLDQRLSIALKVFCVMAVLLVLFLIVFVLPFSVRTYKFDLLTTVVSVLGFGALLLSVKLLFSNKMFLQ